MVTASPSGDSLRCLSHSRPTSTCSLRPREPEGRGWWEPQGPLAPTQHLPASIALTASVLPLGVHSLQETYEAKRKEFLSELQRKEEEMRQMFVNKVKETELELKEKEREVCVRPRGLWRGR